MLKFLFLALYVLLIIGVSLYSRRHSASGDFLLGGRNVGPWLSAFAYGTTYFSAVVFVGYAGRMGWGMGVSTVWIGVGNAVIGSFLAWRLLARRTREMTHRLNVNTMPEYFEKRYDDKRMKLVTALLMFILLVPYSASVYQGLAYLFESIFGVPFIYCMLGMAALTALYLFLGGYIATAFSDFIQAIFMIGGIVLVLACLFMNTDGVGGALERLAAIEPALATATGPNFWTGLLPLIILTSLGSLGLPQMVHKFYAVRDSSAIRRATIISTLFALVIAGGSYLHGAFGRVMLGNAAPVDPTTGVVNLDMVVPTMLSATVPDALMGLIVVLILAASMSTLSSVVLSSASIVAIDLIKGFIKPGMTQKQTTLAMRLLCLAFIGVSVLLAFNRQNAIVTLMSFSWGSIAGVTLGPFIYGLYWRGVTRAGAWAGVVCGLTTTITLAAVIGVDKSPLIGSISMMVSLVVVPVVSLLTRKYGEDHLRAIYPDNYADLLKKV